MYSEMFKFTDATLNQSLLFLSSLDLFVLLLKQTTLRRQTSGWHSDPVEVTGQLLGNVGLSSCRKAHGHDQRGTVGHTYWNERGSRYTRRCKTDSGCKRVIS